MDRERQCPHLHRAAEHLGTLTVGVSAPLPPWQGLVRLPSQGVGAERGVKGGVHLARLLRGRRGG